MGFKKIVSVTHQGETFEKNEMRCLRNPKFPSSFMVSVKWDTGNMLVVCLFAVTKGKACDINLAWAFSEQRSWIIVKTTYFEM